MKSVHEKIALRAEGRVLASDEGYQERDATKRTLDPERARRFVAERRAQERTLMTEREIEIENGLEHLTPAGEEGKR
jgi:hypothetical protein